MGKFRGFRIKKHLAGFTRWVFHRPRRARPAYRRLGEPAPSSRAFSRLITWGRCLTSKTRSLCSAASRRHGSSGYLPLGVEPERNKPVPVPKGHLAVYVGQKDGDFRRVLVPVIYFNHPLFGELLREVEEEYGFNQQGGLTIPCGVSEFERVQTRIAAAGCGSHKLSWKRRV
ncbi:auxin-responsive protein SAUR36-like [Punica granatum]|uniref:Uncharacterized protein n=2 Tax=Punica granatum TaxID=22663 RepID=A0A218VWG1_PUNGR|nr:auxin-responsive protein SAUR36-like [Punica granatum]OWM64914.1 hypothetical protein CDL15_Pgr028631 [Punica granatum]PKI39658.1 hypothetical protein CRG98_039952 [Punica granatum]